MPIEDEFNPSADNPFVSGQSALDPEMATRARSLVPPLSENTLTEDRPSLTPPTAIEYAQPTPSAKPNHWQDLTPKEKRTFTAMSATAAGLLVTGIAAGPGIIDAMNGPEYSPESTTYTVEQGDDWYTVAESIDGHEAVDTTELISHIKADPANIDFLTNDELHPGQSITIPISVEK